MGSSSFVYAKQLGQGWGVRNWGELLYFLCQLYNELSFLQRLHFSQLSTEFPTRFTLKPLERFPDARCEQIRGNEEKTAAHKPTTKSEKETNLLQDAEEDSSVHHLTRSSTLLFILNLLILILYYWSYVSVAAHQSSLVLLYNADDLYLIYYHVNQFMIPFSLILGMSLRSNVVSSVRSFNHPALLSHVGGST